MRNKQQKEKKKEIPYIKLSTGWDLHNSKIIDADIKKEFADVGYFYTTDIIMLQLIKTLKEANKLIKKRN